MRPGRSGNNCCRPGVPTLHFISGGCWTGAGLIGISVRHAGIRMQIQIDVGILNVLNTQS